MDREEGEECKKRREGKKIERLISSWKEWMNDIKCYAEAKWKCISFQTTGATCLAESSTVSIRDASQASSRTCPLKAPKWNTHTCNQRKSMKAREGTEGRQFSGRKDDDGLLL